MNKNKNNSISRRKALKKLSWFGLIPLAVFTSDLTENYKKRQSQKTYIYPLSSLKEVNFFDDLIIIRNENNYKVLSNRCTHLGCKININESDNLLCSCHGSRFSLTGEVLKGPATDPLEECDFAISDEKIIIKRKS